MEPNPGVILFPSLPQMGRALRAASQMAADILQPLPRVAAASQPYPGLHICHPYGVLFRAAVRGLTALPIWARDC